MGKSGVARKNQEMKNSRLVGTLGTIHSSDHPSNTRYSAHTLRKYEGRLEKFIALIK